MNIAEYADAINQQVRIIYHTNQGCRWSAAFDRGEIKENSCLAGVYGNGGNPMAALEDYVSKIKGKVLVFNAGGGDARREYTVPESVSA